MSTHWTEYFGLPSRQAVEAEMPQVGAIWWLGWYEGRQLDITPVDNEPVFVGGGGYHVYRQVLESTESRKVTRLFAPKSAVTLGRKVVMELVDGRRRLECVVDVA